MNLTSNYLIMIYLELLENACKREYLSINYMINICKCMREVIDNKDKLELSNWTNYINSNDKLLNKEEDKTIPNERKKEIVSSIMSIIKCIDLIYKEDVYYAVTSYYIGDLMAILSNPLTIDLSRYKNIEKNLNLVKRKRNEE